MVIDKDGEPYLMYQIELKQYIGDLTKYNDSLEKHFSEILGKCSPAMEQSLESDKAYKNIMEDSDSIGLIKMIECICYNYQSREFPLLGVWESIDCLGQAHRPDVGVSEAEHYENFKIMVEVCKAS